MSPILARQNIIIHIASIARLAFLALLLADPAHADQLVYVALPQPCRLVDTRGSAGGTPLTAASSPYLFGTDTASIASQHGSSSGCGIPAGIEAVSVSMNMLNTTVSGNIATWNADSGPAAPNIGSGVYNPQVMYNTGYSTIPVGITYAGKFYLRVANGQVDMTINAVGYWRPISWGETVSSNQYSVAFGSDTISKGINSTAMGDVTTASGGDSTAMGFHTTANNIVATAMGANTTASGNTSTAMGNSTTASGQSSTAMGDTTLAYGDYSTAMGIGTVAYGVGATAMGANARTTTNATGSFVYGDGSAQVTNGYKGQFMVLADSATVFYSGHTSNANQSDWPGVVLSHGAGAWSTLSDRAAKDAFAPVDARAILERLVALPMATWHYKLQAPSIRHIGLIAQDFHTAFDVGEDDRHISTVDADGVALAAIQGLNAKLEEEVASKEAEIASLRAKLLNQEERLATLESTSSDLAEMKAELAHLRRNTPAQVLTALHP